jgi:hypothetical protein
VGDPLVVGFQEVPSVSVHRKPGLGPGSSFPQLPHGYRTDKDQVRMGVHQERYLAYNTAHNPNNIQTMARGQGGSWKTNHLRVVTPASTSGVIGSQRWSRALGRTQTSRTAAPRVGRALLRRPMWRSNRPFTPRAGPSSANYVTRASPTWLSLPDKSVHNGEKS